MKAEQPAEGILKTHDFGQSKWYHVVCGCGQPDHSIDFEVEADDLGVNVTTYVTVKTDYWTEAIKKRYDIDPDWLQDFDWTWKDVANSFVRRVKLTWQLWRRGYVQAEATLTMTPQQALNYARVLEKAVKDVEQFRREQP